MKFFFNIPFFKIKNIIFLLVFSLSVFSSYGVTVDKSTNYGKVIDAYNGAMGLIGIKNLGKGGYKFVKNLRSQTKQLLQENKGIRNLLSAKYLKWKTLTANLDDISDTKRELINKQEKVWKSLGFADKLVKAGAKLGKYDLALVKKYFKHIQEVTGRAVPKNQIDKLKDALRAKEYKRLSKEATELHRKEFNKNRLKLIQEWEKQTGQKWPTYQAKKYDKSGELISIKTKRYDAHHIIENKYGGDNAWWNLHPAKFPDEHQQLIHGKGSPARELFK